ncbi:peptide-methionine (S)-S-oxide reductase MsrA [Halanaerobacter jeridensis]|uniref:Peptide methionine sulfoxide reductase MsrA n=1 Tax=Halanaerobacter jeridensis TaxID=706427 RepID=A0A938XT71_9FIRM|nr:peptide-methionine (S)-S-oxide reductase MsrA [Halanaerobacter jeridensis]MBM7556429.1 peptide-methionine (S)-S-oxide reductase [Halanaerobacter jeridensis]
MDRAIFAAGCFWGVESKFKEVAGVTETTVGYTGGSTVEPSYEEVCNGDTGHAEAVEVIYDEEEVPYQELLDLFWECHNPTTLNREGPDVGRQYRSAIFYTSEEQKKLAQQSKEDLNNSVTYDDPIVTEIEEAGPFYEAEEYHQDYLDK